MKLCSFYRSTLSCTFVFHSLLLISVLSIHAIHASKFERKLFKDLFENHNKLERPVENVTDSVKLEMALHLQEIVGLDEKTQVLTLNTWMHLNWNDYNLKWHPTDYGNISAIRVPSEIIWIPDIMLYNNGGDSFEIRSNVKALIYNTGDVLLIQPVIFKSKCQINRTNFPFDEQNCKLKLGSWVYSDDDINMNIATEVNPLDNFSPSTEWDVISFESIRETKLYACCPESYSSITYTLKMKRRTSSYLLNRIFNN